MPFRTGFAFHHFMISFGKPIVKNTPLGPESFGDDFHYFGIPFGKPILENTPLGPLQFGEAFHYLVIPFGKPVLENTSLGPEPVQKSFLLLWGPFWRANCRGQASRTQAIWRCSFVIWGYLLECQLSRTGLWDPSHLETFCQKPQGYPWVKLDRALERICRSTVDTPRIPQTRSGRTKRTNPRPKS